MAHPYHHSISSVNKFGGDISDYMEIHRWFDASKEHYGDFRHRAMRHHSQGIFQCERKFGEMICNADGKEVPLRLIAEKHIVEDCGFIPSIAEWLRHIEPQPWMNKSQPLSKTQP